MTVADLVIADLIDECDALRQQLQIMREMLTVALEHQHETVQALDRVRRVQRLAKQHAVDSSVMVG